MRDTDRYKRHIFCRRVIDTLYPNRCPLCGSFIGALDAFCESCAANITRFGAKLSLPGLSAFTAFCEYDDNVSKAILYLKHTRQGNNYYALAVCIAQALEESGLSDSFDLITFPPMTKREQVKRGYNQTKLIARELSFIAGRDFQNTLIKRRETKAQKELSAEERRKNLMGAFMPDKKADVRNKRVLIIDDVCTTGSTLSSAASALSDAGALSVLAAVFAKTPIR